MKAPPDAPDVVVRLVATALPRARRISIHHTRSPITGQEVVHDGLTRSEQPRLDEYQPGDEKPGDERTEKAKCPGAGAKKAIETTDAVEEEHPDQDYGQGQPGIEDELAESLEAIDVGLELQLRTDNGPGRDGCSDRSDHDG